MLRRVSRLSLVALILALVPLVAPSTAFAGSVTGTVTYADRVPNLPSIKMDADPECASKHSGPVPSSILVLGANNTLGNVFVQIKNAPAKDYAAPSSPVVIDQSGCMYEPHVAGVMVGQALMFKNSDGILHNVHGLPKVNREFNIGMPPSLKEKEQTFNKPEPIFQVKCDVHPWMQSFVAVMTHPYFAITTVDGKFSIPNLPAGTYEVEAWHEKLGTRTAKVTVGDGAATVDFSFTVPKR